MSLALFGPTSARADALPPDQDCPSGEVWVRGHSGGCRKVAPSDCAPGWRGVIGGSCVVATAESGACEGGASREVDLCLEKRLDSGNGRVVYDPPRAYEVPVGILGPGIACEGVDRRVARGAVCVAAGDTPKAFVVGPSADGPRAPRRSACAGGGADGGLGLGLAAVAAALARRRVAVRRG